MDSVPENNEANEKVSALEGARERLYSTSQKPAQFRTGVSGPAQGNVQHAWAPEPEMPMKKHPHVRVAAVFFGLALVFFLTAGAIAAYFLYFGTNTVSTNNVDLTIQGATGLAGGDTLPLSITVTNRNPTPISNATLDADFPDGTRSAANVLQTYPRYTENLGTIQPGQTVTRTVKAVLFGAQGQALSIPISLSFGTENSNAVFVKKSSYNVSITSSPLSMSVVMPSQTVSGQPFTVTLAVRSNANTAIGNVAVLAQYPFGFIVKSTSVPAQNGLFVLGTVNPGDTKNITITGVLSGSQNSASAFHFSVGTTPGPGQSTLAITYFTQESDTSLAAPFITASLSLNGSNASPIVLSPGHVQNATLTYTNTLSTAVTNAEIDVQISGGAVDYSSIQTTRGFYRSSDHTIVFSQSSDPTLQSFGAGASGLGTFTFSTASGQVRDPSVTFTISISGTRLGQANVPSQVTASQVVTAKVASAVALSAKSLHTGGPFENSGPIPPTANSATTYTVVWDLVDSGNAIADATVSTVLPPYITFTNVSTPSGQVTYNSGTRTVTWSAGDLSAGSSEEAAFQVSITPSTSQRQSSPSITGPINFAGYDRFAGVPVSAQADAVNTQTPGDPNYNPANGTVQ